MLATNRGKLILAESRLLEYAQKIGQSTPNNNINDQSLYTYTMAVMDTEIPSIVLPLKKKCKHGNGGGEEKLFIHSARVIRNEKKNGVDKDDTTSSSTPLVLLHGYMNGALYFYKNLTGLARYFTTVHSLDMLGCGLSSRPDFRMLMDQSVETTESFFVESLESWRSQNNIDKMVLAGHSMGGYMAIAYSEKYPNRVEKLVLLSPAGIQELNEDKLNSFLSSMSWTRRVVLKTVQSIYDYGITPGALFRSVSEARGRKWVESYVSGRLSHGIKDPQEQQAVADYLYCSSIIPGIGENALSWILTSTTIARKPMIHRIPKLKVPTVSFLYGDHDWMDIEGGIDVQRECEGIKQRQQSSSSTSINPTPSVEVYQVKDAGHLLMLENSEEFNNGVILACGGGHIISSSSLSPSLPRKIDPSTWQQGGANPWQRRRQKEENKEDKEKLSSSIASQ